MIDYNETFAETVRNLFAGEFICMVSFPYLFKYLGDEKNMGRVRQYVGEMGYSIEGTSDDEEENAWYLAHLDFASEENLSSFLKDMKELPTYNKFLRWMARSLQKEGFSPGDSFTLSKIVDGIALDSSLFSEIRDEGFPDETPESIAQKMIRFFEKAKVLFLKKHLDKTYIFTGKVRYVNTLHCFAKDHFGLAKQEKAPADSLSGRLERGAFL